MKISMKMIVVVITAVFITACSGGSDYEIEPPIELSVNQDGVYEITYTDRGYQPEYAKVPVGATVRIVNKSSMEFWPASDPHPVHTDFPQFDPQKALPVGGTYDFKFEKGGIYGFHDHLNHIWIGALVVE